MTSTRNEPVPSKTLGPNYDGHNLVFVVGSARSGTTWFQRLLSTHPQIRTGQESHVFAVNIGPQLREWRKLAEPVNRGGVGLACYFTEEEFLRILKTYLLILLEPMAAGLAPDELFLEKSPTHVLFLPEIFELLPRARVIHVLRDARDVVSSLLATDEWFSWWAPKTAKDAAGMWGQYVRAFRDALPNLPRERIHEIRYEDLCASPVQVLQGCGDFLGLEWDPVEIAMAVESNQASKARANGGGSPIPLFGEAAKRSGPSVVEPKGFVRKAKAGAWREDLSLYEKFRVWRAVHGLMDEVGYSWPWTMALAFSLLSGSMSFAKRVLSPKRRKYRR